MVDAASCSARPPPGPTIAVIVRLPVDAARATDGRDAQTPSTADGGFRARGRAVLERTWRKLLGHPTARGRVYVALGSDGRIHVLWKGESLGAFASVAQAVAAVASGSCARAIDGTEFDTLGISEDPLDWLSPDDLSA